MRYINYYDNDTLSIFDKNTNKILANVLISTDNCKYYDRADVKIMPLIRIVLAIQFCYNVKYVR